ncbi:MAG: hypothetical protein IT572_09170 [Deltaproteobacteria bacterium]|nr:hypothetical protein [Deltaproteobacteria bacterium]
MKQKGFSQKSEAIRQALEESVQRLKAQKKKTDFRSWLGMALKTPLNPKPRFKNEDELWE